MLGACSLEQVEHGARLEQEHASIPVELAAVEELLGGSERGLLDEALDFQVRAVGCLGLDISVARMWAVGDDPERDKCARFRGVEAVLDGPSESLRVGDHVVGGGEQHERVGVSPRGDQCGNA